MGKLIDFEKYRKEKAAEEVSADLAQLESMSRHPAMLARRVREAREKEKMRKEGMKKLVDRVIDEANKAERNDEPNGDTPNQE